MLLVDKDQSQPTVNSYDRIKEINRFTAYTPSQQEIDDTQDRILKQQASFEEKQRLQKEKEAAEAEKRRQIDQRIREMRIQEEKQKKEEEERQQRNIIAYQKRKAEEQQRKRNKEIKEYTRQQQKEQQPEIKCVWLHIQLYLIRSKRGENDFAFLYQNATI